MVPSVMRSPRVLRRAAACLLAALGLLLGSAPGLAPGGGARAQSARPVVIPIEFPDEFHVLFVNGECTQTLIVPSRPHREQLGRFNIAYRRSDGCLWWPLDREMAGIEVSLQVLLKELPDRDRATGFYLGRVMQPEFRLRIANAALKANLESEPSDKLTRPLRAVVDSADVFKELRAIFAANGLDLSLRALEKIERARLVELPQWAVDPKDLVREPEENGRVPIAAIVWFDVKPR